MKLFSKKHLIIFLFISLIIGASGTFYTLKKHPSYSNRIKQYAYRIKQIVWNYFETNPTASSPHSFHSGLKRDPYSLHIKAGKSIIDQPINNGNINQMKKNGELVSISENNGYEIATLTHSEPLLTPIGYSILKQIGKEFASKTNNNDFFVVTSLTRTLESQKKLTKVNSNATKNTSSHSFGSSFDVSYTRFNNRRGSNQKLQKIFEDILISLQQDGKIYVIMEKHSTCYHITVRKQ